ncbi:MAG: hypothetical protein Q4F88_03440 [Eubacteriales bacterium]|nr:hypothetical protein [Eubacteriales bacterium]
MEKNLNTHTNKVTKLERIIAILALVLIFIFIIISIYGAIIGNEKIFLGFIFATLIFSIASLLFVWKKRRSINKNFYQGE